MFLILIVVLVLLMAILAFRRQSWCQHREMLAAVNPEKYAEMRRQEEAASRRGLITFLSIMGFVLLVYGCQEILGWHRVASKSPEPAVIYHEYASPNQVPVTGPKEMPVKKPTKDQWAKDLLIKHFSIPADAKIIDFSTRDNPTFLSCYFTGNEIARWQIVYALADVRVFKGNRSRPKRSRNLSG